MSIKFGYIKSKLGTILGVTPFYPIGYIIEETSGVNPEKWYGGIWELFGEGCFTVCINSSDRDSNSKTNFNKPAGFKMGSKYLQQHGHVSNVHSCSTEAGGFGLIQSVSFQNRVTIEGGWDNYNTKDNGRGDSENIPPAITIYRWRKIAY